LFGAESWVGVGVVACEQTIRDSISFHRVEGRRTSTVRTAARFPFATFVAGCLLTMAAQDGAAAEYRVTANSNQTFTPAIITIRQGDTVRFENAGGVHNVHADDDRFVCSIDCKSNNTPNGAPWSVLVRFDQPGTAGYYCDKHGGTQGGMRGVIVTVGDEVFASGFDP
jgi:plastocyanin